MVAKYWFEQFARVPVDIDVASEFRYREPIMEDGGLALFINVVMFWAATTGEIKRRAKLAAKAAAKNG